MPLNFFRTAFRASDAAQRLAGSLPALLLAAERVAAHIQLGAHGRRRVGSGESFWQFRRYQAGDDIGRIDWRTSARTQHVFIRENEWEAAQTLMLWVDATPSMHWQSDKNLPTKHYRALVLSLAMARLALDAGEQVALLQAPTQRFRGRAALITIAQALLQAPESAVPPLLPLPRFSSVLLVSDFLTDLQNWRSVCQHWAAQGCSGQLLQILDPAELDPPWRGRLLLQSREEAEPLLAPRFESWRGDYLERLQNHRQVLRRMGSAMGWKLTTHNSREAPQKALLKLYRGFAAQAQSHKGLRR
jgi:uncharacterized protein (DUF58 family)